MPGMDRSGPMGQGPATGRGMGGCVTGGAAGNFVPGRGMGRGAGMGRGPGLGRGAGMGRGLRNGFRTGFAAPVEETKEQMEERLRFLQEETANLQNRLKGTGSEG